MPNNIEADMSRVLDEVFFKKPKQQHAFVDIRKGLSWTHQRTKDTLYALTQAGMIRLVSLEGYGHYRVDGTYLKKVRDDNKIVRQEVEKPPVPETAPVAKAPESVPTAPQGRKTFTAKVRGPKGEGKEYIVLYLQERSGGATINDIMQGVDMSEATVGYHLRRLLQEQRCYRVKEVDGKHKKTYYRYFYGAPQPSTVTIDYPPSPNQDKSYTVGTSPIPSADALDVEAEAILAVTAAAEAERKQRIRERALALAKERGISAEAVLRALGEAP